MRYRRTRKNGSRTIPTNAGTRALARPETTSSSAPVTGRFRWNAQTASIAIAAPVAKVTRPENMFSTADRATAQVSRVGWVAFRDTGYARAEMMTVHRHSRNREPTQEVSVGTMSE